MLSNLMWSFVAHLRNVAFILTSSYYLVDQFLGEEDEDFEEYEELFNRHFERQVPPQEWEVLLTIQSGISLISG